MDDDECAEGSHDESFENEDVDGDGYAVGLLDFRNCFAGHHLKEDEVANLHRSHFLGSGLAIKAPKSSLNDSLKPNFDATAAAFS